MKRVGVSSFASGELSSAVQQRAPARVLPVLCVLLRFLNVSARQEGNHVWDVEYDLSHTHAVATLM